jgi:hypothetical protein
MDAAGVISGKIVDVDGDPIIAVTVNATVAGSMPLTGIYGSFGSATTNDLGEYRISDLRHRVPQFMALSVPNED